MADVSPRSIDLEETQELRNSPDQRLGNLAAVRFHFEFLPAYTIIYCNTHGAKLRVRLSNVPG
jgi:hypothetical protein